MDDEVYFRAGVGMLVANENGLVLAGQRVGMPGSWQVPQGGVRPNEEPVEAVRRELAEETGIAWTDVTVLDECEEWLGYELPAGARSDKTGRGQVQKWFLLRYHGAAENPQPLDRPSEFERWEWMPLPALVEMVWPPRQPVYRRLAQSWVDRLAEDSSSPLTRFKRFMLAPGRIFGWFTIDVRRFDDERFNSAVDRFQAERSRHGEAHGGSSLPIATEQLGVAQRRWANGEHEAAWTALKAADRELLELLDDNALALEYERVLEEAKDKLTGWRRAAVEKSLAVLPGDRGPRVGVNAAGRTEPEEWARDALIRRLRVARRIVDDHMDNVYLRMRLLRGHLLRSGVVLVVVLLVVGSVLAWALQSGWSADTEQNPFADGRSFVVIAALGALGAAVSGVVRFMARDGEWKMPQLKAERVLITLRPIVGAAAALIVVGLLASGLGGLNMDADAAMAIALISGFSEALVGRAVAQASKSIAG